MRIWVAVLIIGGVAIPNFGAYAPWAWSNGERIAARVDDSAAASRARGEAYDVILGKRDPQLFLPVEVFDNVVSLAYADDPATRSAYRESKEEYRQALGLPSDMWTRLESTTAAYRAERRRERELALSGQTPAGSLESARVRVVLCRERFAALREAERELGSAFTRFLYVAAAPTMTKVVLRKPDAAELSRIAEGRCD